MLVFGRGGAGKSALAHVIGTKAKVPVVELDKVFWNDALEPMPKDVWADRLAVLAAA